MKLYWMILTLLLCSTGFSQIITVKDVNTKSGIDYVYVFNASGGVYTDDKGQADIADIASSGDLVLNFQHVGCGGPLKLLGQQWFCNHLHPTCFVK